MHVVCCRDYNLSLCGQDVSELIWTVADNLCLSCKHLSALAVDPVKYVCRCPVAYLLTAPNRGVKPLA